MYYNNASRPKYKHALYWFVYMNDIITKLHTVRAMFSLTLCLKVKENSTTF